MSSSTLPRGRPLTLLQERFIKFGFEGLEEEEGIKLALSLCRYCLGCDKLIEGCIKNFKNIRELLSASCEELEQSGVCPRGIFAIKLLRELPTEILKQKIIEQPFYKSSKEVFDYLYCSMRDLKKEVLKAIYLNSRNQIIDTVNLFEGTVESIPIRPREIVESAITRGAAAMVFVHNHPSGDPTPSKSDKRFTRDLVFMGGIIEVKVLDHIIIGGNKYFSFADEGLIKKYELNLLSLRIRRLDDGVLLRPSKASTVRTN